jgi:hypothetical protein
MSFYVISSITYIILRHVRNVCNFLLIRHVVYDYSVVNFPIKQTTRKVISTNTDVLGGL